MKSLQLSIPGLEEHTTPLLKKLISKPSWEWLREELEALRCIDLKSLCKIMGIPHSGTKVKKIARLLSCALVRKMISAWAEASKGVALTMADSFKGKELKALCKEVGCFAPSTKYGMASALLNWRVSCNRKGKDFVKSIRAILFN